MPTNTRVTTPVGANRSGRPGAVAGILLVLALITGSCLPARAEESAGPDTLFLRDGSVLQGTVLRDAGGRYHVTNPIYGKVVIDEGAVLYLLSGSGESPLMAENQVILPGTLEVLTTFSRPVPERSGASPVFHLLVPGSVDAVHGEDGTPIAYESRDIAGSSLVTVGYARIGESVDRVFVTSVQKEILAAREDGSLEFRTKRILNEPGTVRLMVEYPQDWSVGTVSPEPAFRFPGMIVWEASLKRQQTFLPSAVFIPRDPEAASIRDNGISTKGD